MPNMNAIGSVTDEPGQSGVGWTIAIDDTSYRSFRIMKKKKGAPDDFMEQIKKTGIGSGRWGPKKAVRALDAGGPPTLAGRLRVPEGPGRHLPALRRALHRQADGGLAVIRRMFKQNAELVAQGGDPVGTNTNEPYLYNVAAGIAVLSKDKKTCIEADGEISASVD